MNKIKDLEKQIDDLLKQRPEYGDWFEGIREQLSKLKPEERLIKSWEMLVTQQNLLITALDQLKKELS